MNCKHCDVPMVSIDPVSDGDDASLLMWQCPACRKIEMNYGEWFFGEVSESTCDEETQPVEAIPTDSRYTCPVCGGSMVEMPPVPDDIDDPSWHLAYCEFMFTEPQTCRYAWSWHDDDGDDTLVLNLTGEG